MASSSSSPVILNNSQSSLLASSSSTPRTWRYRVFTSFHGPDVRRTFLSHLRKQFDYNGITMFDDQGIERGHTIAPSLTQAIRESKISIVVLSKNYASSSWCLDELVEILKCKEDIGQIVMTVFYEVDPSDVRKQTGDFGRVFIETCARKSEEERERWSQALNHVGNIAGEHFLNWGSEAKMIEKIARDVSDKLNFTPCRDFDRMVGLEAHMREMQSLLDLDCDGVRMVGIYGPAGIGKTTIARALQSLISNRFQLTCFVENLRRSYHSGIDDEYGLKLRLQENLLSSILNQDGTRICDLGALRERLCDLKVFVILDDVNDIKQLEALANEPTWFGPGSRIILTTENKELLQRHGIHNMYHVGFPSDEEALKILCRYAFRKSYPHDCFKKLATSIIELCGKLPLGLRVVGSSLHGKNEDEWECVLRRLDTIIDRDIEEVLRVGYEILNEYEQMLFLHIVVFFNHKDGDLVKAMLADNNLDIEFSLNILENTSLIYISTNGEIVMHKLLQQMGMQAIHRQKPWKRKILIDAQEICDVLENDSGTGAVSVSGISFDTSGINEVTVSNKALRRMGNLRFLRVYKAINNGNDRVHIPEEMKFPPCLRLLHWEAYPSKSLPRKFCLQNLVELNMRFSKLENLWEGTQPLTNLKKMDLSGSIHLKELPNLSDATNLEKLYLTSCESLVELPSSIGNLKKLKELMMSYCSRLRTMDSIHGLQGLQLLIVNFCRKLTSLPKLPDSLKWLEAEECKSLQRVASSLNTSNARVVFTNCVKLGGEARRLIIQGSYFDQGFAFLPGRVMPSEFNHRAGGNSLTIPLSSTSSSKFKACVMISTYHIRDGSLVQLECIVGSYNKVMVVGTFFESTEIRTEHMCIFHGDMPEVSSEVKFEFRTKFLNKFKDDLLLDNAIIECGVRIITDEPEISSEDDDDSSYNFEFDLESENVEKKKKNNKGFWSWDIGSWFWGKKTDRIH